MTAAAPKRRYLKRLVASLLVYGLSIALASYLIEQRELAGPLAFAAALVPGLAVAGMFYAVGMFIVEIQDEFLRMLMVRQQLIAAGFAMAVASVWGFLEMFGRVGHVATFYVVLLWAVGTVIGGLSNRLTHGTWGECW